MDANDLSAEDRAAVDDLAKHVLTFSGPVTLPSGRSVTSFELSRLLVKADDNALAIRDEVQRIHAYWKAGDNEDATSAREALYVRALRAIAHVTGRRLEDAHTMEAHRMAFEALRAAEFEIPWTR